jgi:hypothetical protein
LYEVLNEFQVPMKLARLIIKMCLNETYSKDYIGKHSSDTCVGATHFESSASQSLLTTAAPKPIGSLAA